VYKYITHTKIDRKQQRSYGIQNDITLLLFYFLLWQ